jgi:hypothetical protein
LIRSQIALLISLAGGATTFLIPLPASSQVTCGCEVKTSRISDPDPRTGKPGVYFDCARRDGQSFTQWADIRYYQNGTISGYEHGKMPKGCVAKDLMNLTTEQSVDELANRIDSLKNILGRGNQSNASSNFAVESASTSSLALPSLTKLITLLDDPRQKEFMGYRIEDVDYEAARNANDMLSKAPETSGIDILRNTISALDMSPQWSMYSYIMRSTITTPSNHSLVMYKICFDVRRTDRVNTTASEEVFTDENMTSLEKQNAARLAVWSIFYSFKTKCHGGLTADTQKAYESKILAIK